MTEEVLATVHSEIYPNVGVQYGKQQETPYTEAKEYPTIYAKEKLSVINGNENTTGLGMSEQTALIGRTDEGAELGKLVASESIQPYHTYWYKSNSEMQTAFKGNGYELLIPNGTDTYYWVASRCVDVWANNCYFQVRSINSGYVSAFSLSGSNDYYVNDGARALFPVVSLAANLLTGDSASGWSVE